MSQGLRLLILADTHVPARAKGLPAQVWEQVESADVVIHAGDWITPDLFDELEQRSTRLVGVWGNNDGPELRRRLPVGLAVGDRRLLDREAAEGDRRAEAARRRPLDLQLERQQRRRRARRRGAAAEVQRLGRVGRDARARWTERAWAPEVRVSGTLATVWAEYDFHFGTQFSHCGVDAVQLLKLPERGWTIVSIADTYVAAGCPLREPPKS